MTARRLRVACLAVLALVLSACSTLPVTGEVHTEPAGSDESTNQATSFTPPGPGPRDTPEQIVRGFLLAMQANPPSTGVARSFLSSRAKATWRPSEGTIVYDGATVQTVGGQLTAQFRSAQRVSNRGVWLDGTSSTTTTVPLSMVEESGHWRIDNPPNALAVPASYFAGLFVPYNLYWFDSTGTVLVPTKVYVPQGEETATNLVRGLLAGPPRTQRSVAVSAFPAGTELDLPVVVSDTGMAEVPLGPSVRRLAPADLNRLVVQLAWTLRQVPGIERVRITVDGAPVPLPDGRVDVGVGDGADYDPLASPESGLLAISGGRVVRDDGDRGAPVGGPFGQTGFSLRSLAWDAREHLVAAVTSSGRRVFVAPDRGSRSPSHVATVLEGGTDLLRPAFDRFGGLWLVDNTKSGAVVHVVRRGHDHVVNVRGVTGRQVSAFTVTRDGAAFVAVLATRSNPTVEVAGIVRGQAGGVREVTPARALLVTGADTGPAVDVTQNGATSVAVLTRPSSDDGDQIVYVELDGSPGPQLSEETRPPRTLPANATGLVTSPDPAVPMRVVAGDGRLYSWSDTGSWSRSALTDVAAAAYAQ